MTRILVINGHPDPAPERLAYALASAYRQGAEEAGCRVRRIDIGALGIPFLRSTEEFGREPDEHHIREARDAFREADHLVFVFPLWLGGAPALLKAFMEQVGRAEFLLRTGSRFPQGGLKWRSARVIVTMGMPPLIYRLAFGAHGVKAFTRGILALAGIRPIRTSLFGGSQLQPDRAARLIEKTRELGRRMA